MAFLSIITPTYNRAHTLPRCFESLLRQTNYNFEWVIVDDGSTDDTQEIVSQFQAAQFHIIYIRKQNGGKHTALNAAHPHIHGEYVLILDSDDYLTDTAVSEVLESWDDYSQNAEVGMLTFLKGLSQNEPVCTASDYYTPVDVLRYRRTPIHGSDCCEVVRSELFLKYPFPEYSGEKFISECALWNRVGTNHKCVYIPTVIYICEYLEGGLTQSGRPMRLRNPRGGMFTSNLRMDRNNFPSQRIKYGLLYTCYGCFAGKRLSDQLNESDYPFLAAICYPFGKLLSLAWRRKYCD